MKNKFPAALPPLAIPTPPPVTLPANACDAHVHMVGHDVAFPLWSGRVEDPAEGCMSQWLKRLKTHQDHLGFARIVFVHSILYGPDNSITLAARAAWGADTARSICLVPDDVTDAALDDLAEAGCRGVRLNYVHGGILSWEGARAMAPRLAARGMHLQMLLHSHAHMRDLEADIRALPVPLLVDHIGWPDLARGVQDTGFQTLLGLLADGHIHIKLSAAYRMCAAPYDAAAPFLRHLLDANPERCLWGSDWPHLMLADAALPDAGVLLNQFLDIATETQARQVLTQTPEQLFGF